MGGINTVKSWGLALSLFLHFVLLWALAAKRPLSAPPPTPIRVVYQQKQPMPETIVKGPPLAHEPSQTRNSKASAPFNLRQATSEYLAHSYQDKLNQMQKRLESGLESEARGYGVDYSDLPDLQEAARFFRFYLDVPFGLAQIKRHGRAEARLIKGPAERWQIYSMRGDPYFGVVLHQAIAQGLKEKQVQTALNRSRFQSLMVHLRFLKADEAYERRMPLFHVEGHILHLAAFHIEQVECVNNNQKRCEQELRLLRSHKVYKRLRQRYARPNQRGYLQPLRQ